MSDQSRDSAQHILSEYFKDKAKNNDKDLLNRLKWTVYVLLVAIAIQFYYIVRSGSVTNSLLTDLKRQNETAAVFEKHEMKEDIKSLLWAYTNLSTKMTGVGINTQDTTSQLQAIMAKYQQESLKEGEH